MTVAAVLLAAGAGTRFAASGGAGPKLLVELDGRTVLDRALSALLATVTDGARCFLAQQHQHVVQGLLTHFPGALAAHVEGRAAAADPFPIVALDDKVDIVAVAQGVSRFLAIESCGQCTPCKQDGLAIAATLERLRRTAPRPDDAVRLPELAARVTDGARCYLAQQHQNVVLSVLSLFPDALAAHADGRAAGVGSYPIVPMVDIVDEKAVLAFGDLDVQPDWAEGQAESPADVIDIRRGDHATSSPRWC